MFMFLFCLPRKASEKGGGYKNNFFASSSSVCLFRGKNTWWFLNTILQVLLKQTNPKKIERKGKIERICDGRWKVEEKTEPKNSV